MKRQLSHEEIQKNLYNILVYFAEFCEKNQLTYSLAYGTLLGAIRHKDFIPWDDDIDIYMPRPDYDRMMHLFPNKKESRYHLISLDNGLSNYPFAKIIDLFILVEEKCSYEDKYLWIDIFPIDGMPKDEKKCIRILKKAKSLQALHTKSTAIVGTGTTIFRAIVKIPFLIIPKIVGASYYGRKLNRLAHQYPYANSDKVGQISWTDIGEKDLMDRSMFCNYVRVFFHDREFSIVAQWDKNLRTIYGDYMKLPPEKNRKGHNLSAFENK